MESGWLAYEFTKLTHRDVLLGAALSLPKICKDLAAGDQTAVNRALVMLGELSAICDPSVLSRVGYGLDRRLAERLATNLQDILLDADGPGIIALRELLRVENLDDQLLEICLTLTDLRVPHPTVEPTSFVEGLAAALPATLASTWRTAQQLSASGEPLSWEIGSRLRRMDLVLVDPIDLPDSGVVLGCDVSVQWDAPSDQVIVEVPKLADMRTKLMKSGWMPADETFIRGLEAGLGAAKAQLKGCGIQINSIRATCNLRGILPPQQVYDESAGLPFAMRILSERADLPMNGWLPTGSLSPQTHRILPITPDLIKRKLAAMSADGINKTLLVYCAEPIDIEGVCNLPDPTLGAAAQVIWGERWKEWVNENRNLRLTNLKFQQRAAESVWADGLAIDGNRIIVEVPQVREFSQHFQNSHPTYGFLGGPPRTGKTWIAQQVADLAAQEGWQTITLIPTEGGLPRLGEIRSAIELLIPHGSHGRTLIILDDIEWDTGRQDFEEDVREVCALLGVSILAVIRSGGTTDWKLTGSGLDASPIIRPTQQRDFISRLSNHTEFSSAPSPITELAGQIINHSNRDLWLLVRLADLARRGGDFIKNVNEFFTPRIDGLTHGELETAQALAALSLVGLDAPDWLVPNPHRSRLAEIGAAKKGNGRWSLGSRAAAIAVLEKTRSYQTEIPQQLGSFIMTAIQRSEHREVTRVLDRLTHDAPHHLWRLHQRYRDDVDEWVARLTQPDVLARSLESMQGHLTPKERGKWAQRLVRLLVSVLPNVTVWDLAESLDVLHDNLFVLEHQQRGREDWAEFLVKLPRAVQEVLGGSKTDSGARLRLVRALWRLHEDATYEALRRNWEKFLEFDLPYELQDYRLALESLDIARKLPGPPANLGALQSIQNLATAPIADETADLYAARVILRETIFPEDRRTVTYPQIVRDFPAVINRSSPHQLCNGLGLLASFDRAFAVGLLNYHGNALGSTIAARFSQFKSPGEMADLLFITSDIHAQTARRLLYESHPVGRRGELKFEPRLPIVDSAAKAIFERADGKGAGRLLKATLRIDSTFGSIMQGFSGRLVEKLGKTFFLRACEWEPRTSVLFHLIEGLIAVEAPFIKEILKGTLDAIQLQIESNMRHWAPRLALLLSENPDCGTEVCTELATRLTSQRLLECMTQARRVESLAVFHQLGTLLYQERIPGEFRSYFELHAETLLHALLAAHRPEVIIRAARSLSHTLRRGGVSNAGEVVLSHLDIDWGRRLARARTDGDLAETIRGLTALNSTLADECVKKSRTHLHRRAVEALGRQPQTGAELLESIESASPGIGSRIVADAEETRAWASSMRDIAHEQDPRAQGTTYHMLAQLGGYPNEREIDDVFSRWKEDVRNIASPAGLVTILRALAAWDYDRTKELSNRLSATRLVSRIQLGARQDVKWVESLVGALLNLDRSDLADEILDALPVPASIPSLLGPMHTSRLITLLREERPVIGRAVAEAAVELVIKESQRRFVSDDSHLLTEIGWLAFAIRQSYEMEINIGDNPPWPYQLPHTMPVSLWGHAWLERRPWVEKTVIETLQKIESVPRAPWACAATLIVAASYNKLHDLLLTFPEPLWVAASQASLYFVEAMLAISLSVPEFPLGAINLSLRFDAPHERLHPVLPRLSALLP